MNDTDLQEKAIERVILLSDATEGLPPEAIKVAASLASMGIRVDVEAFENTAADYYKICKICRKWLSIEE
jgi:hypothetical protein